MAGGVPSVRERPSNAFFAMDTRVGPTACNDTMGPDNDRWSDTNNDNMQALVELPPLEYVPTQVPLTSNTDLYISQESDNARGETKIGGCTGTC